MTATPILETLAKEFSTKIDAVRNIFEFVLDYSWVGLGAGFGPALMATLFWKRATGWGILSGIVTGFTVAIVWKQFPEWHRQFFGLEPVYSMMPALLLSAVAIAIVSLSTPPDRRDPVSE